jgi:hypothetical protein
MGYREAIEENDADARADFRSEAARAVIEAAENCGWFLPADTDTALDNGLLRPSFVRAVDKSLDEFKSERRGEWPREPWALKVAFDEYLSCYPDALARVAWRAS